MSNYLNIKNEIDKLAKQYEREISLLVVSKTYPYSDILSVYENGGRIFGENKVQEIISKYPENKPSDMKIYLIGHLQKNKVSKIVPLVDRIESVDSIELLDKINSSCLLINKTMPVLLEYNVSGELNKHGFESKEEILKALEYSKGLSCVNVIGIMAMGPLTDDETLIENAFKKAEELYLSTDEFLHLSMGMSGDYHLACKYSSNEVRIGSSIFGARK